MVTATPHKKIKQPIYRQTHPTKQKNSNQLAQGKRDVEWLLEKEVTGISDGTVNIYGYKNEVFSYILFLASYCAYKCIYAHMCMSVILIPFFLSSHFPLLFYISIVDGS